MNRIILSVITIVCSASLSAQPLGLAECRKMAIDHNESLRTADNAVRQAELDRQIAFAGYLPKVDGSLAALYMKDIDVMGMKLLTHGTYMAGLTLTQPLYAGGQITAGNRLARIGKEVAEQQRRQAQMQVIADVDKAYYTLIAVGSKVQMLEAYARQMQGLYDQVEASVNADLATRDDLLRISAKQREIDYQLQKARNGEELCHLALANAIGADLQSRITPTDTIIVIEPPADISDDISCRPEVHLLETQVEAKQQMVKMARANYLPVAGLSLGYTHYGNLKVEGASMGSDGNYYPFTQSYHDNIPMAVVSVSVPLFHWGAEFKKVKKAKLDVENARQALEQNKRGMRIEVRQAVQNLTDGYRMVETARIGQQQAEENLRVMRQKFDNQMATMTDLLDAQSQWQQARSNMIEAQTQYKIYQTDYLMVTGRLE